MAKVTVIGNADSRMMDEDTNHRNETIQSKREGSSLQMLVQPIQLHSKEWYKRKYAQRTFQVLAYFKLSLCSSFVHICRYTCLIKLRMGQRWCSLETLKISLNLSVGCEKNSRNILALVRTRAG